MEYIIEIQKGGKNKRRKAETAICEYCKLPFLRALRFKTQRFCSKSCKAKTMRTSLKVNCCFCGKEYLRKPSRLNNTKSKLHFCSRMCKDKGQRIENGLKAMWPTTYGVGTYIDYSNIAFSHFKAECVDCKIDTTFLLCVHHKDGNRENNNKENLEIVCANCHIKRHLRSVNGVWVVDYKSLTPIEILDQFKMRDDTHS
jgi:hypothetical protein